jgi:putative hydrolase of HD superfamily
MTTEFSTDDPQADGLLALFLEATTLKRLPRAGWLMRGVPQAESVADHSHVATLVALALADTLNASGALASPLDIEKVLTIAALHDLAEARLTDLPASAQRLIPESVKRQAEATALADMLAALPGAARLTAAWREFEDASTPEGRLVRDADKLEMMAQCLRYEQTGVRTLAEFWAAMDRHTWHYAFAADLYRRLRSLRPEPSRDRDRNEVDKDFSLR